MNGRSPARLLAPLALVVAAIALVAVVSSGGRSDESSSDTSPPVPTMTAVATPTPTEEPQERTYTVQPGDTPSSIAAAEDVDVEELLEANPDIDPAGLTIGEELTLP